MPVDPTKILYPARHMHPFERYDVNPDSKKVFAWTCSGALCGPGRVMARRTGYEEFCDENGENCATVDVFFSATVGAPYDFAMELVEDDCFAPFGAPTHLLIRVAEVSACPGVGCQTSGFTYSHGDGKWHGAAVLPGGSIEITGECLLILGVPVMALHLEGCGISDDTLASVTCFWPFSLSTAQWTTDTCCDCEGGGGTIAISIEAPVFPRVYAKLVDYNATSGKKVFARPACETPVPCTTTNCCAKLACTLYASFEADPLGPCACLDGLTIQLAWNAIAGAWQGTDSVACSGGPITLTLFCENDPDADECANLNATLVCGGDCGMPVPGALFQICDDPDTEVDECADVDHTFGMSMSCVTPPPPCCEGGFKVRITK